MDRTHEYSVELSCLRGFRRSTLSVKWVNILGIINLNYSRQGSGRN
jgi:hypothetical protein